MVKPAAVASDKTYWIDLNKVILPEEARPHLQEDLDSLAQDMNVNGQLQEIVVIPAGPMYRVLSGVGRVLAARQLGWERIRAFVKEGLTDFEKLRITFSENEEREDVSPIYQGRILKKMMEAEKLTQAELAKQIGKTQGLVSKYVAVATLDPEVQQNMNIFILKLYQLNEITRLKTSRDQIRVADECVKKGYSLKQLKSRVNQILGRQTTPHHPDASAAAPEGTDHAGPCLHLTLQGDQIFMTASYSFKEEKIDEFLSRLKGGLDKFMKSFPDLLGSRDIKEGSHRSERIFHLMQTGEAPAEVHQEEIAEAQSEQPPYDPVQAEKVLKNIEKSVVSIVQKQYGTPETDAADKN